MIHLLSYAQRCRFKGDRAETVGVVAAAVGLGGTTRREDARCFLYMLYVAYICVRACKYGRRCYCYLSVDGGR